MAKAPAAAAGYCMKCKTQREIKNAKPITMKNGRPATEGTCPVCSTKMFKIGASKVKSNSGDVVAGAALVEELLEHLDAGHDDLAGGLDPDELDLVADLDDAALDAAGRHGPPALDPEDILDRHEERLVDRPLGGRDVRVDRVHQLLDAGVGRIGRVVLGLERLEGRAADERDVVARELVLGQELADLELDEVEQFGSSTASTLLRKTTMYGTSTWLASRMCSRVWGIGPSVAATTRMAPSIWAAPVIMFLM